MQNTLCECLRWLRIDFNIVDDKICLKGLKSLYGASRRVYEGGLKIKVQAQSNYPAPAI
jgi:hypothetical protein